MKTYTLRSSAVEQTSSYIFEDVVEMRKNARLSVATGRWCKLVSLIIGLAIIRSEIKNTRNSDNNNINNNNNSYGK